MSVSRRRRGSIIAAGVVAVSIATIVAVPIVREEIQLRSLESEDEEVVLEAIRTLGEIGSKRAVPKLCAILIDERWTPPPPRDDWEFPKPWKGFPAVSAVPPPRSSARPISLRLAPH